MKFPEVHVPPPTAPESKAGHGPPTSPPPQHSTIPEIVVQCSAVFLCVCSALSVCFPTGGADSLIKSLHSSLINDSSPPLSHTPGFINQQLSHHALPLYICAPVFFNLSLSVGV
ncbi:hypothetical protein UPYG_G00054320 [Umbra pygmaea]|uniref:Uncharacterized protein n=1 Tax=Umbra pygmaea TaxID=75934 RepID=A0ABD0XBP9_UMBPY